MNAKEFFDTVAKMSHAQKQYFKTRSKEWLIVSKQLEKKVDDEIRRVNIQLSIEGIKGNQRKISPNEKGGAMTIKINMAGLMRWHRNNPRKRLDGYLTVDGKDLTHNQVLAALEYAIEHNCRTEQDIPTDIVEKIVKGEIVPKKGGEQ